jgi:cytochrome oxidase assembly protein ShyY1
MIAQAAAQPARALRSLRWPWIAVFVGLGLWQLQRRTEKLGPHSGKHRTRDAACEALEDTIATRH